MYSAYYRKNKLERKYEDGRKLRRYKRRWKIERTERMARSVPPRPGPSRSSSRRLPCLLPSRLSLDHPTEMFLKHALVTQARSSFPGGRPWVTPARLLVKSFQFNFGMASPLSDCIGARLMLRVPLLPRRPRFDGHYAVWECLFHNALADGPSTKPSRCPLRFLPSESRRHQCRSCHWAGE